ncbi:MAG: sulfatase-like hydrolase/transferase [Planctomycetota bacterium]
MTIVASPTERFVPAVDSTIPWAKVAVPKRQSRLASLGRRLGLSFLFAYLLFLPYFNTLASTKNRRDLSYSFDGVLVSYLLVGALALLIATLSGLADAVIVRVYPSRRQLVARVLKAPVCACAVLTACYMILIHLPLPQLGQLISLYHHQYKLLWLVVTLALIGVPGAWPCFARIGQTALLMFAPMPVVLLAYFAQFSAIGAPPTPAPYLAAAATPPAVAIAARTGPVYFFVFDEWDYDETFRRSDARTEFPNLTALASTSHLFSNAHSTQVFTEKSIPNILFQANGDVRLDADGSTWIERNGQFADTTTLRPIHAQLASPDDLRIVIGRALPYRRMLGSQVDWVFELPYDNGQQLGLREQFRALLFKSCFYSHLPIHRLFGLSHYHAEFHVFATEATHRQTLTAISRGGAQLTAFIHYLLPHPPFYYTANGVRPNFRTNEPPQHPGYRDNLAYLDRLIGEIVAAIRAAGHWETCSIIMTGDHGTLAHGTASHDHDDARARSTAVPLVIKLPGQRERVDVGEAILTTDIAAWITARRR